MNDEQKEFIRGLKEIIPKVLDVAPQLVAFAKEFDKDLAKMFTVTFINVADIGKYIAKKYPNT
jgi:hypothetical protein